MDGIDRERPRRLPDERIREGILHADQGVREAALRYFSHPGVPDPAAMPAAIQAVDRWGWEGAFSFPHMMGDLGQSDETLRWLMDRLREAGGAGGGERAKLPRRISRIIAGADGETLRRHHSELLRIPALEPEERERIEERVRLCDLSPEDCWRRLETWCEAGRRKQYLDEVNIWQAYNLVEAAARGGAALADRVLEILAEPIESYEDNPMGWMEGLAPRLAGEIRLDAAVPLLIDKLHVEGDWTNGECERALSRIGTDRVVHGIEEDYLDGDDGFQISAASVLESLHSDASLETSLRLFDAEEDISRKLFLAHSVLGHFAPGVIPAMRGFILATPEDPERNSIQDLTVALAVLAGSSFPEIDDWRREAAERLRKWRRIESSGVLDDLLKGVAGEMAPKEGRGDPTEGWLEPPAPGRADAMPGGSSYGSAGDPGPAALPPGTGRGGAGRNRPCPCGSGKKYKKCCLLREQPPAPPPASAARRGKPSRAHKIDERLVTKIGRFIGRRLGDRWRPQEAYDEDLGRHPEHLLFFVPWSLYCHRVDGRTAADRFADEEMVHLSGPERSWLDAQRAAWLSIWEVTEVRQGSGLSLEDLFTGDRRDVSEVSASELLRPRMAILARVVQYEGTAVLCGLYPNPLPPLPTRTVVEKVRDVLEAPAGPVPATRLREEDATDVLVGAWREAVRDEDDRSRPRLQNMDGDVLLMTTDHFGLADPSTGGREAIIARIRALEGAGEPEEIEGQVRVSLSRPPRSPKMGLDTVSVGVVVISGKELAIETNSVPRADAERRRVEEACGEMIRFRRREHADPYVLMDRMKEGATGGVGPGAGVPGAAPGGPPEGIPDGMQSELDRVAREWKERYYEQWLDEPIPALGGATPREAAADPGGREDLSTLLKDFELREGGLPEEQRFDVSGLRKRLGLEQSEGGT